MWRFLGFMAIAIGAAGVILWSAGYLPFVADTPEAKKHPNGGATQSHGDIVEPIAPSSATRPTVSLYTGTARPDAVTIPDTVINAVNETEIGSRIDGKVAEMPVWLGKEVKKGELLMKLDDVAAQRALEAQKQKVEVAISKIKSTLALQNFYKTEVQRNLGLKGAVSDVDKQSVMARLQQAEADKVGADAEKLAAEAELKKMEEEIKFNEILSNRDGRIDRIYNNKKAGEVVKSGEPLFRVVSDDKLRAEGAVEAHLEQFLRKNMIALVEPERQLPPYHTLREHTGPVTDLAVTADGRFLATASKDGSVIISDWWASAPWARLGHPEEVYAVACGGISKPDAQGRTVYTFATGCGHGRAFLWQVTVDKNGRVAGEPKATEFMEPNGSSERSPHGTQPVRAVAFSGDGGYVATGGDDYQICFWKADNKPEFLCRVGEKSARAHRGAVTSLAFKKDGELISAGGTDKTIKRWKIGRDASGQWTSKLVGEPRRDRAGQVTHLGLTADGGRILFDYGDELRILDTNKDWSPLGALRNGRPGAQFQNLAILSPSGQMALAVSAGRLQLWGMRDPKASGVEDRALSGFELRQLMTADASKITCGAFFAPRELGEGAKDGEAFAFTGSEDGTVQVWRLPSDDERTNPLRAKITYVGSQVERGGAGLLQVRAELDNPTDARRLKIGQRVNLTVFPEATGK